MASWKPIFVALLTLLIFSKFTFLEARKRKRGKHDQKITFSDMCSNAKRDGSHRNMLNIEAFFDLRKSFTCLKMETCSFVPLCFVEETPDLGKENLHDCALWNLILHGLQTNRKIEPVMDNSFNAPKRTDDSWDDALSILCSGVNVYRFLPENTGEEEFSNINRTVPTINSLGPRNNTIRNATTTKPLSNESRVKKRQRRGGPFNRLLRQIKRTAATGSSNSSCGGLEHCDRICVGQNAVTTNLAECMTFKIQCTTKLSGKNRRRHKGRNKKKNKD
ncbi:uncharacterized protein [Montipora foliosa]|uniref:uncharacterized protein n=1 Tax=Montipora foliosa TaxID=591990 RepID=UPI0035F13522